MSVNSFLNPEPRPIVVRPDLNTMSTSSTTSPFFRIASFNVAAYRSLHAAAGKTELEIKNGIAQIALNIHQDMLWMIIPHWGNNPLEDTTYFLSNIPAANKYDGTFSFHRFVVVFKKERFESFTMSTYYESGDGPAVGVKFDAIDKTTKKCISVSMVIFNVGGNPKDCFAHLTNMLLPFSGKKETESEDVGHTGNFYYLSTPEKFTDYCAETSKLTSKLKPSKLKSLRSLVKPPKEAEEREKAILSELNTTLHLHILTVIEIDGVRHEHVSQYAELALAREEPFYTTVDEKTLTAPTYFELGKISKKNGLLSFQVEGVKVADIDFIPI